MSIPGDPKPPRLLPWGVYSRQDIISNLRVTAKTFDEWTDDKKQAKPLRSIPIRSKEDFYFGNVVFKFLESLSENES